jgi:hypothetical protein
MVLAAAVVLTACGSAGGSSNSATKTTVPVSRKIVLTSIMTTAAAKTARVEIEAKVSGAGPVDSFTVNGDGAVDFGSGDSQLTMTFGGQVGSMLGGDGIEFRMVDGVGYMRMPSGLGILRPGGKPWVAIDNSSMGGAPSSASPFGLGDQTDPTKALAYLEAVSNEIHEVGPEQIRGVDTTHYSATLDLTKAINDNANVPPGLRESMKELAGLFGDIPANVWIDGDGRLRRMSLTLDVGHMFRGLETNGTTPADNLVVTETLDFYDFGTPVHVEAPPADQVSQFPNAGDVPSLKIDANA